MLLYRKECTEYVFPEVSQIIGRQLLESVPSLISSEEKIQIISFSGQGHNTVFWDCEGVIPVDAMRRRETINSDAHIGTLTELT
jgi:sugar (pentulose or hexulose) kinase